MEKLKRILYTGEFSGLATGYGTISMELMKRLHASGKYELAEQSAYLPPAEAIHSDADRQLFETAISLPWKCYPVLPKNEEERKIYNSNQVLQFGEWKFEETCLDFRPDVVFSIRDIWMDNFIFKSPFRSYYKFVTMPTVDSAPQEDEWIDTYIGADAVTAYTDWSLKVLQEQSCGKIKSIYSTPPGVDFENYYVSQNKEQHKNNMGFAEDTLIIGTIMRNQKRKLFPDLFKAFAKLLNVLPEKIKNKVYLYCHTTYPDLGWKIPRLIKELGITNKVLFTYYCRNCKAFYPQFFSDLIIDCKHCGQFALAFPRAEDGIEKKSLAHIINCFDVYVQYASAEAAGVPLIEAAGCGIPIFGVDYSGMHDILNKLEGTPIKVKDFFRDAEMHTWRAYPDNEHLIKELINILSLPKEVRRSIGYRTKALAEKYYNWDAITKLWMDIFDGLDCLEHDKTWHGPSRIFNSATDVINFFNNDDFVNWCLINVAGRPDLVNSYLAVRLLRDLNNGATMDGVNLNVYNEHSAVSQNKYRSFNRTDLVNQLLHMNGFRNFWEQKRICKR